jgi:[ribosomal protein S5]-alanine N-acetyltransferase
MEGTRHEGGNTMIADTLETDRLRFRRLTMGDADELMEFFSNAEAMRFFNLKVNDRSVCETWIEQQLERYKKGSGLCALVDKHSGRLAGQCGLLFQEVDGAAELEVGYDLIPRFWGKGYATEAAIACRDLAFTGCGIESLVSIIDVGNIRSQKVADRNGMKPGKRTRWRDYDVIIYRITRGEWEKIASR